MVPLLALLFQTSPQANPAFVDLVLLPRLVLIPSPNPERNTERWYGIGGEAVVRENAVGAEERVCGGFTDLLKCEEHFVVAAHGLRLPRNHRQEFLQAGRPLQHAAWLEETGVVGCVGGLEGL